MSEVVYTYHVVDPSGEIWATPKGKRTWETPGAAKNAWSCHTWVDDGPNPYNSKLRRTRQAKWSVDASGWKVIGTPIHRIEGLMEEDVPIEIT